MPSSVLPSTTTTTTTTRKKESKHTRSRARVPFPEKWFLVARDTNPGEFERFKNHAIANGRLCAGIVGWQAAWRNWLTSPFRQNGSSVGQAARWKAEGKSEFTGIPRKRATHGMGGTTAGKWWEPGSPLASEAASESNPSGTMAARSFGKSLGSAVKLPLPRDDETGRDG